MTVVFTFDPATLPIGRETVVLGTDGAWLHVLRHPDGSIDCWRIVTVGGSG